MKKILFTLSIALCFNSVFALDPAYRSFEALGIHQKNQYNHAVYTSANQSYNAYFNANGEMVTAFRHIVSTDLPMNLSFNLKKFNKNMWVTDVVEVLSENKTIYYVNLENADEKITLKSRNGNKWKIQKS